MDPNHFIVEWTRREQILVDIVSKIVCLDGLNPKLSPVIVEENRLLALAALHFKLYGGWN
jgi:hypothetical protein